LIAIKKLLFLCGLKQTTYRRSTIFIYVTKTTDFWGNIFTLVEGTGPATMLMKITFKKDVTPSIPWSGQFIEHTGDNLLPMFGSWKHMVWMYNGTSSTYSMFIDGKKLDLPASLANA
jgi:hypothetical protein